MDPDGIGRDLADAGSFLVGESEDIRYEKDEISFDQ